MNILITGALKSGKSRFACDLLQKHGAENPVLIATSEPFDDGMKERIQRHKTERARYPMRFRLIEETVEIDKAAKIHPESDILLDCLTVWMSNLFFKKKENCWEEILKGFYKVPARIRIVVTNELGWGNVPFDETTRKYNEHLAKANIIAAELSDEVYLMVSGIPVKIK